MQQALEAKVESTVANRIKNAERIEVNKEEKREKTHQKADAAIQKR